MGDLPIEFLSVISHADTPSVAYVAVVSSNLSVIMPCIALQNADNGYQERVARFNLSHFSYSILEKRENKNG